MVPNESTLKKEFSKRDVQRMRNLITGKSGDRTQVQAGWKNKHKTIKKVMFGKKMERSGPLKTV